MPLHLYSLSLLLLLLLEVILRELTLALRLLANEKTLLSIPLHSHLVLLDLDGLLDVELEDLDEACVAVLLWTLKVESFVELHLGEQVINVFRLVVELIGVPFAKDAILVIHHLFALVKEGNSQDLKADGAL